MVRSSVDFPLPFGPMSPIRPRSSIVHDRSPQIVRAHCARVTPAGTVAISPLQIGARDMAFPKLNALSYWLLLAGGIILYAALLVGPPASGWTSYVPLSTLPYSPSHGQDLWLLSLTVLGFSSIFGALNMIVTIFALRAPGMTFSRITLFTWSVLVTSFLLVLAIPFLTVAGVLLLFDRLAGLSFFATSEGSDPLLWQFLFWFFGHPEVYIMVLPGFRATTRRPRRSH